MSHGTKVQEQCWAFQSRVVSEDRDPGESLPSSLPFSVCATLPAQWGRSPEMGMFCPSHSSLGSWFSSCHLFVLLGCLPRFLSGQWPVWSAYPQWSGLSPSWVQVSLCSWGVSLGDHGHSHLFLSVLNAIYWEFRWFLKFVSLLQPFLQADLPACPPDISFLLLFSLLSSWSFNSQPEWQLLRETLPGHKCYFWSCWLSTVTASQYRVVRSCLLPLLVQAGSRGCTCLGLFVWAGLVLGLDWVRPPESVHQSICKPEIQAG